LEWYDGDITEVPSKHLDTVVKNAKNIYVSGSHVAKYSERVTCRLVQYRYP